MPLYEYHCNKCDTVFEKIVKFDESEETQKCNCGNEVKRKRISKSNFKLKGKWFKNNQEY